MPHETIGDRIQQLRNDKGLTQSQLAKELFVTREVINHWELNTRDLKTDYTIKLADYFNVTCDYILRGVKANNIDVNKKLGLSDKAIEKLISFKQENESYRDGLIERFLISINPIDTINFILESEAGHDFLLTLKLYFKEISENDVKGFDYDNEGDKFIYKYINDYVSMCLFKVQQNVVKMRDEFISKNKE